MKIYFAGAGGYLQNLAFRRAFLFSYFLLISPDMAYNEMDLFLKLLDFIKRKRA